MVTTVGVHSINTERALIFVIVISALIAFESYPPKSSWVFILTNTHFIRVWDRVLKCDVNILQTFPFKPLNLIVRYTQPLYECVQNFKSLALVKVKIEKFEFYTVPY